MPLNLSGLTVLPDAEEPKKSSLNLDGIETVPDVAPAKLNLSGIETLDAPATQSFPVDVTPAPAPMENIEPVVPTPTTPVRQPWSLDQGIENVKKLGNTFQSGIADVVSTFTPLKKNELYNEKENRLTTPGEFVSAVEQNQGVSTQSPLDSVPNVINAILPKNSPGMWTMANAFKDAVIARPIQDFRNSTGRSFAEAALAYQVRARSLAETGALATKLWVKEKLGNDPTPEEVDAYDKSARDLLRAQAVLDGAEEVDRKGSTALQLLERQMASFIGGDNVRLTEDEATNAVNQLDQILGVKGSAAAQFVAGELGNPIWFLPVGKGLEAARLVGETKNGFQAAKAIWEATKAGGGMGLKFGAATALASPGKDITTEIATQTGAGAALGGLGGVGGEVAKAVAPIVDKKIIAIFNGPKLQEMTDELLSSLNTAKFGTAAEQEATARGNAIMSEARDMALKAEAGQQAVNKAFTDFKEINGVVKEPTFSKLVEQPDGLYGVHAEVNVKTGSVKLQKTKLTSTRDMDAWIETSKNMPGMAMYPEETLNKIIEGVSSISKTKTPANGLEAVSDFKYSFNSDKTSPGLPRNTPPKVSGSAPEPLSIPEPKEIKPPQPLMMVVDGKGKVSVEKVFADPDTRPRFTPSNELKPGDLIDVANGHGTQPMVVRKVNEDGTIDANHLNEPVKNAFRVKGDQVSLLVNGDEQRALAAAGLKNELPVEEFLQSVQDVTPQRLMAYYGISPQRAHQLIDNLVASGKLRRLSGKEAGIDFADGFFAPPQKYQAPKGYTPPLTGTLVYRGAAGENAESGVFRGFDANRQKYVIEPIVDNKPTGEKLYLDAKDFNSYIPADLAQKQLAKLDPVYGINMPIPEGAIQVSGPSDLTKEIEFARNFAKRIGTQKNLIEKVFDNTVGTLWHEINRGPSMLRGTLLQMYSAKGGVRGEAAEIVHTLLPHFKQGINSKPAQELVDVLHARMTAKPGEAISPADQKLIDWANKYPEEAAGAGRLVKGLMDEKKANSEWLAKRFPGESIAELEGARLTGDESEYLKSMYKLFEDRQKWIPHVQKNLPDVWQNAIETIVTTEKARGNNVGLWQTERALAKVLREASNPEDVVSGLVSSGVLDKKAANSFLHKKELSAPIKALLGEETSGILRLGNSIAAQRSLKTTIQAGDALAQTPYWSRGPRGDLPVQIPNNRAYGAAAGGFTTPEFARLVSPEKNGETVTILNKIVSFASSKWKSNVTVYGGPSVWVNNFVRNFKPAILSGGLDPYNPVASAEGFLEAAKAMHAARTDMTVNGPAKLLIEARQMGGFGPGFAGSEVKGADMRLRDKVMRELMDAKGPANVLERINSIKRNFQESVDTKTENVRAAYDAIDQWWKLGSYINLRKKFISQGMELHDAAALAAERVYQSFPFFNLQSETVDKLRRGIAGPLAPFLTSKIEDWRINGMAAVRVGRTIQGMVTGQNTKDSEPDLLYRVAAAATIFGAAKGYWETMRRMNGIPDDVVEKAKQNIPLREKGNRPGLVALPQLDAKGRVQFLDLTSWEDMLMSSKGPVQNTWMQNFLLTNATDVVGQMSPQGQVVQSIAAQLGVPSAQQPGPLGNTPPAADQGFANALMKLAESGGVPQWPLRAYNTAVRAGYGKSPAVPDLRDEWTPNQLTAKELGLPFAFPVDTGMQIKTAKELQFDLRNLKGGMKTIEKRPSSDPETQQERRDRQLKAIGDRVDLFKPSEVKRNK